MMFGLKEIVEPFAEEIRAANKTLLEVLRGINAEQRRTNSLLEEMLRVQPRASSRPSRREPPS